MKVLRHEIQKKGRHKSIRRLLKEAGPAIQDIKPVFMMSPLSVSQYLEPGAVEFDMLLIDEASQIEPVDALGAVARCKQVVVVGDHKTATANELLFKVR
jgi:superfamily I DNA and/or RNA helicase